ncbi:MAG: ATP-dependent zinc metalloprotease FtsH [Bacteroidetes bacterium]|nr:ATP-dependent zinc metalloprotease FtsH [Bacteroidota bacterium]
MEPNKTNIPPAGNKNPTPPIKKGPKFNLYWIYGLFAVALIALNFWDKGMSHNAKEADFQTINKKFISKNLVDSMVVFGKTVDVYLKKDSLKSDRYKDLLASFKGNEKGPHYAFTIGNIEQFRADLDKAQKDFSIDQSIKVSYEEDNKNGWLGFFLQIVLPLIFIVGLWVLIMRKMGGGASGGGPGGIFNIGKSKAQLYDKGAKVNITFNDVAGLDEAKGEVMEIVDFLKNPKKYTALGGKIPRGCLLVGPPGTGKTLLAKAMAGEAQVPFFSMSGSDFVEMFVGVGASRVRDLFKQAREKSPCIIFIDEIDAIGRARGKNQMMSNDERENTLNQMLVEMDGFSGDSGIIVLAATNRPDVLDVALLRPGRFDRQISIDIPDLAGREAIFKVHLKGIKTSTDLDVHKLAAQTPGFAGADIANVCNEAALIAARKGKTEVNLDDFNDAVDRIIGGLEKKNKIIRPDEKKVIAYHEAGHAVSGWFLEHAYPLVKVTIVPRGDAALGYAQYLPKEKYLTLREELEDRMAMALGGRAVEELVFGKISTGALSDLQQVTKMAYAMVSVYGMNDKIGNVSFYDPQSEGSFQKPYSEETGKIIDDEVRKLSDHAYTRVKRLLTERMHEVKVIAEELLLKEVLYKDDLERLIGKRPFDEVVFEDTPSVNGATTNHETNDEQAAVNPEIITPNN